MTWIGRILANIGHCCYDTDVSETTRKRRGCPDSKDAARLISDHASVLDPRTRLHLYKYIYKEGVEMTKNCKLDL